MGCIPSKHDYDNISSKKGKKMKVEKVVDLETTMKDDIFSHKISGQRKLQEEGIDTITSTTSRLSKNKAYWSGNGDGIEGLSSTTLDNNRMLMNRIQLPDGIKLEQWIYLNLKEFIETIEMLYDSVSEICTSKKCPQMTAGSHYTYFWTDLNGSNPVPLSAKEYIGTLFESISDLFNSTTYSGCSKGIFPNDFMQTCRVIFKKLFRVYAHVYHHHIQEFTKMGAEAHLNTTFKMFVLFEREYAMINQKEELPLRKLIQRLVEEDKNNDGSPVDLRSIMTKGINSVSYRRNTPHSEESE